MVAGFGLPWLHWADLTVTINNHDSGHDTSCDPWSIFGLCPFDGFSKMSLATRSIFFRQYLPVELKSIRARKEKCFTEFCIFPNRRNCRKHLWAVCASSFANMEPDPQRSLLRRQLAVFGSLVFTNTQSRIYPAIFYSAFYLSGL